MTAPRPPTAEPRPPPVSPPVMLRSGRSSGHPVSVRGRHHAMRFASLLAAAVLLAFGGAHAAAGRSLLFIGNSFTFGANSPVQFYRADTVTDLNNEGIGGVPALVKSFTSQAGLDYDVSLETRG